MKLRVCKLGAEGNCSVSSIKEESVRLGSVWGRTREKKDGGGTRGDLCG